MSLSRTTTVAGSLCDTEYSYSSDSMTTEHVIETDLEHNGEKHKLSFWQYLQQDVDPLQTTGPLSAYCFMTGYLQRPSDVISFSAIFVWCGFQTGNFVQLCLAVARVLEGGLDGLPDKTFHRADQQALCSLIAFQLGSLFGRIGDRMGPHKRLWLMLGTFIQAVLTLGASLCFLKANQPSLASVRYEPSWSGLVTFVGLGCMSFSLGIQGIIGQRLNTQFGTTIVITGLWVELMGDPSLFHWRKRSITRDHRVLAVGALFLGAISGRTIISTAFGTVGALGFAVAFRVFVTLQWLFIPSKPDAIIL